MPSYAELFQKINTELHAHKDPEYWQRSQKYYTGPVQSLGVPTPIVRKISQKYFPRLPKEKVFAYAEELLKSNLSEKKTIAFDWAFRVRRQYSKEDFITFSKWLTYLVDWGDCDDFCTHALGYHLVQSPGVMKDVKKWTISPQWLIRRASAVALIYGLRQRLFLQDTFNIALKLLPNQHDLVRKGVGWMLKEAANNSPEEVFSFILKHKDKMSRTTLRYATSTEIITLLEKEPNIDQTILQERKQTGLIHYLDTTQEEIITHATASEIMKAYFTKETSTTLQGIVASKPQNIIQGSVSVIKDIQRDTFLPNTILVTSMTRPEFVPLMRQAKAIITDEGGITCHAAIVSRELGIPCIIGTKQATRLLQNGDTVEIDTTTGKIIRKHIHSLQHTH